MGVLWSAIGASPAYEIFTGCAETLAGVLLIFPRTTLLGAMICLADTVQIFTLNMTYDVPVKLFSFHLLLMSVILLAPEFPRLAGFFFLNRTVEPSTQPQLFQTRANRIALAIQIAAGLWILGTAAFNGWTNWYTYGGGRAKSPLYGIWNVDRQSIDGQLRAPLLTDSGRWRRLIFDMPTRMTFQRMDNSLTSFGAAIDGKGKTLVLTRNNDASWRARFTFERPSPKQLILDGDMDGHKTQLDLQLVDRNTFLLVNRGLHWIQEYPFNR